MKLISKKISLKEDTEKDIQSNNIDTNLFLDRIRNYLDQANYLINNKMDDFNSLELYNGLKKVFDISFDKKDYLAILSMAYQKHYTKYITLHTNMYDNDGNNISYLVAATQKSNCIDNDVVDLNKLRKLTNSSEILVLKTMEDSEFRTIKREKFENHQFINIDIDNPIINEDSELFLYAICYLKDNIIIKDILYDLKIYVDEVIYQLRCITGYMFSKNERLSEIGKAYKKAYDMATNKGLLPKKEKIAIHHHKKVKKANNK